MSPSFVGPHGSWRVSGSLGYRVGGGAHAHVSPWHAGGAGGANPWESQNLRGGRSVPRACQVARTLSPSELKGPFAAVDRNRRVQPRLSPPNSMGRGPLDPGETSVAWGKPVPW
jgi:hypothetical protein